MKRALAATVATAGGLAALLSYKSGALPTRVATAPTIGDSTTTTTTAAPDTSTTSAPDETTTTPSTAAPTTARPLTTTTTVRPTTTTAAAGIYRDGQYTGTDLTNRYGDVQVQAVVRNGKLIDVVALQLPVDRSRSQQISDYSAPILHDEAIQAQSARIDTVSGATYTSAGYAQSLQAALDAARRA